MKTSAAFLAGAAVGCWVGRLLDDGRQSSDVGHQVSQELGLLKEQRGRLDLVIEQRLEAIKGTSDELQLLKARLPEARENLTVVRSILSDLSSKHLPNLLDHAEQGTDCPRTTGKVVGVEHDAPQSSVGGTPKLGRGGVHQSAATPKGQGGAA